MWPIKEKENRQLFTCSGQILSPWQATDMRRYGSLANINLSVTTTCAWLARHSRGSIYYVNVMMKAVKNYYYVMFCYYLYVLQYFAHKQTYQQAFWGSENSVLRDISKTSDINILPFFLSYEHFPCVFEIYLKTFIRSSKKYYYFLAFTEYVSVKFHSCTYYKWKIIMLYRLNGKCHKTRHKELENR